MGRHHEWSIMAWGYSCELHRYLSIVMVRLYRQDWPEELLLYLRSDEFPHAGFPSHLPEDAASNSSFLHLEPCKLYGKGKKYQKSKNKKVCQRAKREISYFFSKVKLPLIHFPPSSYSLLLHLFPLGESAMFLSPD